MALIAQFAGMALFWAVYAIAGLKPAIAATLALIVSDLAIRHWRGQRPQLLFLALSLLSIALGIIDLWAETPFAILYEGVATNLVFAAMFAVGSLRTPPLMQAFAEAARGRFANDDPGRTRFFRAFGHFWAGYFVSRAGVCLATAVWLPLPQALLVRSTYATATIVPMIALSIGAKSLFLGLRARGWFSA